MAKVTSPSDDFKFYISSVGRLTLGKDKAGNYYFKKYSTPRRIAPTVAQQIAQTVDLKQEQWKQLTQQEKDEWNTKAQPLYMTGQQLFIKEGFKEGLRSRYGLAVYGQAYYIKSP